MNKDTCQSLRVNFAKALHSAGMTLFSLPLGSVVEKEYDGLIMSEVEGETPRAC